ncbi:hypothetical protein [Agrobacterium rosae]|uniref:hypothetical protein n=1 Tax=Agrobacterium rosae TaxID=1972867 RepID=UPI003A80AD5F
MVASKNTLSNDMQETRLLVLGDSHVHTIKWATDAGLISMNCEFAVVGGATAVGLRNPNSVSNAMPIFEQAAFPVRKHTVPVIQLGEVDCGFVIWWRAIKYGETVDDQVEASITSYFAFVDRLLVAGYPIVIITGATLPTIQDGQDWGEVANLRKDVTASLRERTALTLRYNIRLEYEASTRGLPYVDISSEILDEQNGVLRPEFRSADPTDHHLAPDKAGPLWTKALKLALSENIMGTIHPSKSVPNPKVQP